MDPINLSKKIGGKIEVRSKLKVNKKNLSVLYTPGVAKVSIAIAKNKKLVHKYTVKKNLVAVVSDGSAVLGLGNIGPEAALPVMEGKSLLMKELGGVDAVPIVLETQDSKEIISIIKAISPTFGGINLEDISSPRCFEIEEELSRSLKIPVFHDDQHGTAIVVLAGLINALKVVGKNRREIKVAISGAGAAGIAIAKLLLAFGISYIILADSKGIIFERRSRGMNKAKEEIARLTNRQKQKGSLASALEGTDVFIGVSAPNVIKYSDIEKMADSPIVFAMSNPVPEIMPDEAKKGGAVVVATGRSDYPNQINNVLVFPGVFRGVLDNGKVSITTKDKLESARAIAALVTNPNKNKIIPSALDKRAVKAVAGVFRRHK